MKPLAISLFLLILPPAIASADVSKSDLVGRWACHESRDGTSQNSTIIYRQNGRFKLKFIMKFTASPNSKGMRGTLTGKWAVKGTILAMQVARSRVSLTANSGGTVGVSEKLTHSEIVEFSTDHMVIKSTGGAGPMRCKRAD